MVHFCSLIDDVTEQNLDSPVGLEYQTPLVLGLVRQTSWDTNGFPMSEWSRR